MMNKPIHNRKSIRLPDYDYSQNGAYFVTICSYQKSHLFGDIQNGQIILNKIGATAKACWEAIPDHFTDVTLLDSVIMPNHIHGIIVIQNDNDLNKNKFSKGATCCAPTKGSLGEIIRSFKGAVTRTVNSQTLPVPGQLWQRGYYEHVIVSDRELRQISDYISNNPVNWGSDEENFV